MEIPKAQVGKVGKNPRRPMRFHGRQATDSFVGARSMCYL